LPKQDAEHAKQLRERFNACFELANLPDTSEAERRRLLSFVVVGGGPTGTELAAEMDDLVRRPFCLPKHQYCTRCMHARMQAGTRA
jgi:NADH dehydrogenase FAD-containing subunit